MTGTGSGGVFARAFFDMIFVIVSLTSSDDQLERNDSQRENDCQNQSVRGLNALFQGPLCGGLQFSALRLY